RSDSPADLVTPITCHRFGTAWQKVCSRPRGSILGLAVEAKTTPDVPMVACTAPGATTPSPTAPAAWSPAPATTGVPAARPVASAPCFETVPQTSGDSTSFGSAAMLIPVALATSADQRRLATSN